MSPRADYWRPREGDFAATHLVPAMAREWVWLALMPEPEADAAEEQGKQQSEEEVGEKEVDEVDEVVEESRAARRSSWSGVDPQVRQAVKARARLNLLID